MFIIEQCKYREAKKTKSSFLDFLTNRSGCVKERDSDYFSGKNRSINKPIKDVKAPKSPHHKRVVLIIIFFWFTFSSSDPAFL